MTNKKKRPLKRLILNRLLSSFFKNIFFNQGMMKVNYILAIYLVISLNINQSHGNWLSTIGGYLGYQKGQIEENKEIYQLKIPYEVSAIDENFIKEAAKLTDLALSELDSCQQRVILKLKSDCDKLNDEQLAKMAVHLLNCQSWVEGRPIYPCTDEMSIKDCTISMDSDTWTSYHLMSNRARAVCYTIRQSQFRGLAEHTINRLMDAAKNQLKNLGEISNTQQDLRDISEKTYLSLSEGQRHLFDQQDNLKKAQFHGQLALEDNIRRLVDEKRLITETHNKLVGMTKNIQEKLEASFDQLHDQSEESKINHKELISDLLVIQEKAKEIFERIEQSSSMLIQQNEDFNRQYRSTFSSLQEMNRTVSELVTLVKRTWSSLEERLTWIVAALGGTDMAIDRIYIISWHSAFILMAMLMCAFLGARPSTRLAVTVMPPVNLALALTGDYRHLDFLSLVGATGIFIAAQAVIIWAVSMKPTIIGAIKWKKEPEMKAGAEKTFTAPETSNDYHPTPNSRYNEPPPVNEELYEDENMDSFNITPPESRNGHYFSPPSRSRSRTPLSINTSLKGPCRAKTRVGTPCKLTSLPGRDFCYRHQSGSSVAL